MTSRFPMDEPLRCGNRPKPQHWKSDGSTEVEETSAEEDRDWNDDSDADGTIDTEDHSSLSGRSACALASDGQASLRRNNSETDLSVSEEEVNQIFACWKEDLVSIIGLYGPVVDKLPLANVSGHGWDTEQYFSEVFVAGFKESERKTSDVCRKVFTRARFALPCAAPRGVGEVCLVCRERVLSDAVGPCGYYLHCACLAEGLRVQVLCNCYERHQFCVYCGELLHEPVPCAQKMELCKALEELHVELEDLLLEQYRIRDELPLMQQWPRGRADDRVTLPAGVEMMDLLTTAISQPTSRAAELWRLRNVFEDFFDARCSQLIRNAEIALPILMSWDLLVIDKSRSGKSTEQILEETTRPCPRCFVLIRRAGGACT